MKPLEKGVKPQKQDLSLNRIVTILFIVFGVYLQAQDLYEHDLNEEQLSSLKEKIRHNSKAPSRWTYENDKEWQKAVKKQKGSKGKGAVKKPKENTSRNISMPRIPNFAPTGFGLVFQVILYVVLGAALALLIYFLFISSSSHVNGKKYTSIDLEDIEPSKITKTELEKLLEEALENHDYRKAVRIYYLFILKDLFEKKWIQWEKEKTNMHYLLEMQGKNEFDQFQKIVTYFEFIWYGKRDITKDQFNQIQPNFTSLLKKLGIK